MKITHSLLRIPYEVTKCLLMRPTPFLLKENQKSWASRAKSFYLEVKEIKKRICVYEYGDGPTILLIHGWGGRGLQLCPLIQPLMNLGYQVVLFDAPGHGESDGVGSTYLEFVKSLSHLANHYSDIRGVVAHSMGCGAAVVLANQIARSNFKTVLIAPHYDMQAEFKDWAKSTKGLGHVLNLYIQLSEILFSYNLSEINPKNLLKTQKGPFLLIHDIDDPASKFNNSELLHQYLPNSKLLKTVGKGHNRILHEPEVLKNICSFFAWPS
ncbi:MAG: alpha/beta hydrolase [Bdellovibrio sp.]|nr:alpha/beta hydrolase [Bdellovibrio sp.]